MGLRITIASESAIDCAASLCATSSRDVSVRWINAYSPVQKTIETNMKKAANRTVNGGRDRVLIVSEVDLSLVFPVTATDH